MAQQGSTPAESFESLSIDRPDVSNLPTTVWKGHYQLEIGTEWDQGPLTKEFYAPNLVLRTGLSERIELRLGFNRLFLDSLDDGMSDDVLFVSIGGKYRFVEEDGARPSIAIQPEFSLPFGGGAYIHHDYPNYALADYSIVMLFNNTLHKQVFLNYNVGVFWSRNGRVDYLLSASASFLHTHRIGYFFEGYTLIEEKSSLPLSFDAGLMFLSSPRIQFDLYIGNRGVDTERFWFWGGGVGFRIDPKDMKAKTFQQLGVHH
jgi:hypothetical protein